MNSRIVKLITDADAYAWTQCNKYLPECGEVNYLWEDAFRRKFAELIVRECMAMCQTAVGNADYNTGRLHCLNNIKEHFGVKA